MASTTSPTDITAAQEQLCSSSLDSKEPRVSAVVLNYFGADKTKCCVASLLGQKLAALFVVDNSASDEETARLRTVLDELAAASSFPIHLRVNERNLGFGLAINKVIRECKESGQRSDYYLALNNDARASENLLPELLKTMRSDPRIVLVSPRIIQGGLSLESRWYYRFLGHVSDFPNPHLAVPFLSGSCFLVDGRITDSGELFDEDFFMYGEDVWLSWHVMRLGYRLACATSTSIEHEGSASSKHGGLFYEYHSARGHILLGLKMVRHPIEVPALIVGRIFYLAARALFRSIRFRSINPLWAYLMAWFPIEVRPG